MANTISTKAGELEIGDIILDRMLGRITVTNIIKPMSFPGEVHVEATSSVGQPLKFQCSVRARKCVQTP